MKIICGLYTLTYIRSDEILFSVTICVEPEGVLLRERQYLTSSPICEQIEIKQRKRHSSVETQQ